MTIDLNAMVGSKLIPELAVAMFRATCPAEQRADVLRSVAGVVRAALNAEIQQMRQNPDLQTAVIDGSLGRLHAQAEQVLRVMCNRIAEQNVFAVPQPADNGSKPKIVEP